MISNLSTRKYVVLITFVTLWACIASYVLLVSYVFPPDALPKTINVGYVGLPYVS